jgi:hypothetical protein
MSAHRVHTFESCRDAAARYATRKAFCRNDRRAYEAAARNGWLDALLPLQPQPEPWTRDRIAEVAKLYETRKEMEDGPHQWAVKVARRNGWLDALPPRVRPVSTALNVDYDRKASDKHPLRYTYVNMLHRCYSPTNKSYKNYGARGITVCEEWRNSFEQFVTDMGPRPTPEHSIDRIDNDGNYTPYNCRWATRNEQAQNQTQTKLTPEQVSWIRLSTLTHGQLAKLYQVNPSTISSIKRKEAWADTDAPLTL